MNKTIVLLILCLSLTACGPGQMFGPTITPSPTITPTSTPRLTPTITPSPTSTLTPTITPSPTPSTSCTIPDGKWEGEVEKTANYYIHARKPLFSFEVKQCFLLAVEIWSFPATNKIFMTFIDSVPINDNSFNYDIVDQSGTHTFEGVFTSETSADGTLFFPEGFTVMDYILPNEVTLKWTAHSVQ